MGFTRVSIANPDRATMALRAFVVLGRSSLQRLKIDQFPAIRAEGAAVAPRGVDDRTIGRFTGAVERASHGLARGHEAVLDGSLRHRLATTGVALLSVVASVGLLPRIGTEFVPKADDSETSVAFCTTVGSAPDVTESKARQVEALVHELPEVNREVEFTAKVSGRALGEVSADIRRVLERIEFPPGHGRRFGGSTEDMPQSFRYALSAPALAVGFINLIPASQFRSVLQPLALMASLPPTLIGVVLGLLLFRSTLNMFPVIGILVPMGLVTTNAILRVDFAIRSRGAGHGPARGAAARRAPAAAAHPDHDAGDDLRHGAAGCRADRGSGAARTDGPGGHRRRDHVVAADAGGGAGRLLLARRAGHLGAATWRHRAAACARSSRHPPRGPLKSSVSHPPEHAP